MYVGPNPTTTTKQYRDQWIGANPAKVGGEGSNPSRGTKQCSCLLVVGNQLLRLGNIGSNPFRSANFTMRTVALTRYELRTWRGISRQRLRHGRLTSLHHVLYYSATQIVLRGTEASARVAANRRMAVDNRIVDIA